MGAVAADVMERQVLSVSPETPLIDVQRLFYEEEIHGAPVVGSDGKLLGIIASGDLLRAVSEEHDAGQAQTDYLRDMVEFSAPDWVSRTGDFQDRLSELRAEEYMTADPACVSPDTPVGEIARIMARDRIHRVLVVEGDRLAGLVTAFDLVRLLEKDG